MLTRRGFEFLLLLLVRAIERPSIGEYSTAFTFQVHHWSARRHGLLLEIRLLKLLDRFGGDLEVVVEEILAEAVPIKEAEALVRAPFTEL
jgi:hypothetical protein